MPSSMLKKIKNKKKLHGIYVILIRLPCYFVREYLHKKYIQGKAFHNPIITYNIYTQHSRHVLCSDGLLQSIDGSIKISGLSQKEVWPMSLYLFKRNVPLNHSKYFRIKRMVFP